MGFLVRDPRIPRSEVRTPFILTRRFSLPTAAQSLRVTQKRTPFRHFYEFICHLLRAEMIRAPLETGSKAERGAKDTESSVLASRKTRFRPSRDRRSLGPKPCKTVAKGCRSDEFMLILCTFTLFFASFSRFRHSYRRSGSVLAGSFDA